MLLVISLAAGLVLAVILQLMLTNLGIALGLTVLDLSPAEAGEITESGQDAGGEAPVHESVSLPITHFAGFGIAATLTGVLFAAALLGTEFSEIANPRRGAIFGLMLWGAYWLLFLWLSTTTLAGIAGSILGTLTAAGQRLVKTVRQSIQPNPKSPSDEQSMLRLLVAAVGQEALAMEALPQLLAEERENLVAEICDRTRLTPDQANTVLDNISPAPQPSTDSAPTSPAISNTSSPNFFAQFNLPSWRQLLMQGLDQIDVDDLDIDTLWQQAQQLVKDNQGIEGTVQAVAQDLRTGFVSAIEELTGEPSESAPVEQPGSPGDRQSDVKTESEAVAANSRSLEAIQNKLIAYCRYTSLDSITPASLIDKLHTQLEEHDLNLQAVNQQLDIEAIKSVLSRRKNITAEQEASLTHALQSELLPRLSVTPDNETSGTNCSLHDRLDSYFRTVNWDTVPVASVKTEVMHILHTLEHTDEIDWSQLMQRVSIPPELRSELLDWLRTVRKPTIRWAKHAGASTQELAEQLSEQVADYLRHQDKPAFKPKQLSASVGQLVKGEVRSRLPDLSSLPNLSLPNTRAWKDALAHRRDLTTPEIQEILQHTEAAWHETRHGVETLWTGVSDKISAEMNKATAAVRSQFIDSIEAAQQAVQAQAETAQRQADAVRRQVAIAAWWLFLSLLSSGTGSAIAGWLATRY